MKILGVIKGERGFKISASFIILTQLHTLGELPNFISTPKHHFPHNKHPSSLLHNFIFKNTILGLHQQSTSSQNFKTKQGKQVKLTLNLLLGCMEDKEPLITWISSLSSSFPNPGTIHPNLNMKNTNQILKMKRKKRGN